MKEVREWIVPGLCVFAILVLSFSVYRDLTGKSKSSGESLGSITYRYRVAQRRSESRAVWEDVEQKDSVYGRDTIRTDDKSEAIILLTDGTKIEMDPQSMIVLNIEDSKTVIDLPQGSLLIRDAGETVLIRPKDSGQLIAPRAETRLYLRKDGFEASGKFEYTWQGKKRKNEGQNLLFGQNSLLTSEPGFENMIPGDNYRVFIDAETTPVKFSWKGATGSHKFTLSEERSFASIHTSQNIESTGESGTEISLKEGIYYWKIEGNHAASLTHKLRIVRKPGISLVAPAQNETIEVGSTTPLVNFQWSESDLAIQYSLNVSRDASFKEMALEKTVLRGGISTVLGPGHYYWKVVAKGAIAGSEKESSVQEFTVKTVVLQKEEKPEQEKEKADTSQTKTQKLPLVAVYPSPGQIVDMSSVEALTFIWKGDPSVKRYAITLYHMQSGGRTQVFQSETALTALSLTDLSILDTGDFYWEVLATGDTTQKPVGASFKIVLSEKPTKPQLQVQ